MTTATPATSAELEEFLGDADKIVANRDKFKEVVAAYAAESARKDPGLQTQIAEGIQAGLADFYRENGVENGRPDIRPDSPQLPKAKGYNKRAPGACLDGQFESLGDMFQALYHESAGVKDGLDRMHKLRNDYSSTVPSEGGFLIPEEFRAEMLQVALSDSVVRKNGARVIPMNVPRIKFPMIDSTSNASSVFGGIVGYWTEEAADMVPSSAKFGTVTLDAQKLTLYTEVPNELLADSAISVDAHLNTAFPQASSWFEDDAYTTGNGVGMPLGFNTAGNTATVVVAKESGQTAATIVMRNLTKMYARMLPSSLNSAVWVINGDTIPALMDLSAQDNSLVWASNLRDGPPFTILGRPVVIAEKVPTLGTQGDISFVDFRYYLIGDRQAMTVDTSPHYRFRADMQAFRVISRVDGKPWIKNAITPRQGSNTLSPFVTLATRA